MKSKSIHCLAPLAALAAVMSAGPPLRGEARLRNMPVREVVGGWGFAYTPPWKVGAEGVPQVRKRNQQQRRRAHRRTHPHGW